MKTWEIKNGDVAVNPKARVDYIDGANKVVQDLRSWLTNHRGFNKFHPFLGTRLDNYIGQPVDGTLLAKIRDEVRSVLNRYIDEQMKDLKKRIAERGDSITAIGLAEPSSMVQSWTNLDIFDDYGTIYIRIGFRTFTDDTGEVMVALDNGFNKSVLN